MYHTPGQFLAITLENCKHPRHLGKVEINFLIPDVNGPPIQTIFNQELGLVAPLEGLEEGEKYLINMITVDRTLPNNKKYEEGSYYMDLKKINSDKFGPNPIEDYYTYEEEYEEYKEKSW